MRRPWDEETIEGEPTDPGMGVDPFQEQTREVPGDEPTREAPLERTREAPSSEECTAEMVASGEEPHVESRSRGGPLRWIALACAVAGVAVAARSHFWRGEGAALSEPDAGVTAFAEGLAFAREGSWSLARERFELAAGWLGAEGEVGRYLDQARIEEGAAARLAEAKARMAAGDPIGARHALEPMARGSRTFEDEGAAYLVQVEEALAGWGEAAPRQGSVDGPPMNAIEKDLGLRAAVREEAESRREPEEPARVPRRRRRKSADPQSPGQQQRVRHRLTPGMWVSDDSEERTRRRLADGSVQAASDALVLGRFDRALDHLEEALRMAPDHPGAVARLDALRERREAFFVEGYSLLDRDPQKARERLELVLRLTLPSQELHKKARRWLATLKGKERI